MASSNRLRASVETLSRDPEHVWPDALLHHGARLLLLVGVAAAVTALFPVAPLPELPTLEQGDVIDEDIIAKIDFPVVKTDAELARERLEAAAFVTPTFSYDSLAVDTMRAHVESFMASVDSVVALGPASAGASDALVDLLDSFTLPSNEDVLALLRDPPVRMLLWRSLRQTLESAAQTGVAAASELDESRAAQVRVVHGDQDGVVSRDAVVTQTDLFEDANDRLGPNPAAALSQIQQLILIRFGVPTLRLDRETTERDRENARRVVPIERERVLAGQRIVAAHEPVTADRIEKLEAYSDELARQGRLESGPRRVAAVIAVFVLNLLLVSILGFLLFFYRRDTYANYRHVALLTVLLLAVSAGAAVVTRSAVPVELVPIAFAALTIAILWDGRMALVFALVLALLLSTQTPLTGIDARLPMIVGGAAAALSVRVVRRRAQGLILGAVVAAGYVVVTLSLALLLSWEPRMAFERAMWGSVNGMGSALLAMGLLPLFESFTRITTDQTLLELADLSRPLLKRLSLEASGTYAHSINVANLAEAAARGIDANPLLARVGAYYHDVGKMSAPQYFIENQVRGRNPHDALDPAKSAQIVREHVLEGMRLAEQAKLPDCVKVFIPEHHGTQMIGFFYERAKEGRPEVELSPSDFAYPGPRPQSKETAILMLADSVESAAKVLQEPTAERVRTLVNRIVDTKIERGQLDEAPLTMHEITRIKEQFAAVLNGMYHHRIDYPSMPIEAPAVPEPSSVGGSDA